MRWLDVLMITFSCVAANHLGLVAAAEGVVRHRLPVMNCPKCAAFWCVLAYGMAVANAPSFTLRSSLAAVAAAFLAAWSAVWLDLLMGITDNLYTKLYDTLYPTADTTHPDALGTENDVPGLPVEG